MNVELGTGAVQFPEKEYTNGIFYAVRGQGDEGNSEIRTTNNFSVLFSSSKV
jgi:hypothetical protein